MAFDRFLISGFKTGLETDVKPWQVMDDAFTHLKNAYVFRGRLRKRFGSFLMGTTPLNSQLRVSVGVIAAGGFVGVVPGSIFIVGQMFSAGTQIFTAISIGVNQPTLATGPGTGTYSTTNGALVLAGTGLANGVPVYFYPAQPVMGITQYATGAINNAPSYAFDTQFAYVFVAGAWARSGTAIWHGSNAKYFWATNWQGSTTDAASPPVMFVTNFNATTGGGAPAALDDPMWFTPDGATWTPLSASGVNVAAVRGFFFLPNGGLLKTGGFVQSAKIIVAFKNRLLLLNTIENDNSNYVAGPPVVAGGTATAYINRCRYSFNGSPFARNAWYEPGQTDTSGGVVNNDNIAAGAGFFDATTEEAIVSVEFIKDRLIVYFERSTWEIVYTRNESSPFVWQKINNELGSQSTFSSVSFDTNVFTIGNTGVHACSGTNVKRIDNKIPDLIFNDFEVKNGATLRTCGIRDYFSEMVYWAYCENNTTTTQTFPNQVLAYNYRNDSWSTFDDTITTFGYFEQGADISWATSFPAIWATFGSEWSSSFTNAGDREILMGTPQGFVVTLADDMSRNAASMYISNMAIDPTGIIVIQILDHNLEESNPTEEYDNDFIYIENVQGDATLTAYFGTGIIFPVLTVVDANTIVVDTQGALVAGVYTGGGTAARVSNILAKTKQFNPYDKINSNVYISKVDFAVQPTMDGAITVDYFVSDAPVSMIQGGVSSGSIMGTSILETSPYDPLYYPMEQFQKRLWHPIYFQSSGECIQFFFYFSPEQMVNPNIVFSTFELEPMMLFSQSTSSRME